MTVRHSAAVLFLLASCEVASLARGQPMTPVSETELVAAAVFPDFLPQPAVSGEDAQLYTIIVDAGSGNLTVADSLVASLTRQPISDRARFVLITVAEHVRLRRYRLLGGGHLADGASALDLIERLLSADTADAIQGALAQRLPPQILTDVQMASGLLAVADNCVKDGPAMILSGRVGEMLQETRTASNQWVGYANGCVQQIRALSTQAVGAGFLGQYPATIVRSIVLGDLAAAEGDSAAAHREYDTGWQAARAASDTRTAAEIALREVDARVMWRGSPLSLGYNLIEEPIFASDFQNGMFGRAIPPLDTSALLTARKAYATVRGALVDARCRAPDSRIALRLAVIDRLTNRTDSALMIYHQFAAGDDHGTDNTIERIAAQAALGVLTNTRSLMADALRAALARSDTGTALSVAEMAQAWGMRLVYARGAVDQGEAVMQTAADVVGREGLPRAAVPLDLAISRIEQARSRWEAALAADQAVVRTEREFVPMARYADSTMRARHPDWQQFGNVETSLYVNVLFNAATAVGLREMEEGPQPWAAQRDSLEREFRRVAAWAPNGPTFVAQYDALRDNGVTLQAVNHAYGATHGNCAAFLDRIRTIPMPLDLSVVSKFQLDFAIGPCDSTRLPALRARLASSSPVPPVAAALGAVHTDTSWQSGLSLRGAVNTAFQYIHFALLAGAYDLVDQWGAQLESLARNQPLLRGTLPGVRVYHAMVDANRGAFASARDQLTGILEDTAAFALLNDDSRQGTLSALIDLNARLGHMHDALALLERLLYEQNGQLQRRNGLTRATPQSAEIARLARTIALQGSLSDAEEQRLTALREAERQAVRETPGQPSAARIDSVLHALPAGTILLAFYFGPTAVIAWRADSAGVTGRRLAISARDLHRRIDALADGLANNVRGLDSIRVALYNNLLAPFEPLPPGARFIILRSAGLQSLPFEVLGRTADSTVLASHPTVYVDRISDPQPRSAAPLSRRAVVVGVNGGELQHAEGEARAVANSLRARPLTGDTATVDTVSRLLPSARYIHIAAHTVIDQANPYESALQLADGNYRAWQLFQDAPAAELIVLSACDTYGTRTTVIGEPIGGAQSLSRSALAGGAHWVIASQWLADDSTTAQLMQQFYGEFIQTQDAPLALQHAKAALGRAGLAPFYYAPFVISARDVTSAVHWP